MPDDAEQDSTADKLLKSSPDRLGAALTIFNGAMWVVCIAAERFDVDYARVPLAPLSLPMIVPFGICCLPGHHGFGSEVGVVVFVIMVGINSLLWGHGISHFVREFGLRRLIAPFRRRFRFSLRTLLIAMLVGGPLLAGLWRFVATQRNVANLLLAIAAIFGLLILPNLILIGVVEYFYCRVRPGTSFAGAKRDD